MCCFTRLIPLMKQHILTLFSFKVALFPNVVYFYSATLLEVLLLFEFKIQTHASIKTRAILSPTEGRPPTPSHNAVSSPSRLPESHQCLMQGSTSPSTATPSDPVSKPELVSSVTTPVRSVWRRQMS